MVGLGGGDVGSATYLELDGGGSVWESPSWFDETMV